MEVEWQTLLQNQAAKVQAQACWSDRAMNNRCARTWKPCDSKPSGRRARVRLIIKGFTDPDLVDIESHSRPLTWEDFMTVLQSVCSHGHKLQFGDVQPAFNTGDPIKRKQPLFVRMPPDGESRDVWVQLRKTVYGLADRTRARRNCFLAAARGLEFKTSVLETCAMFLWSTQQKYHGTVGVAVDDITGGSKLKQRVSFGYWEVGKFCSREVIQTAEGSMRAWQPVYIKSLDFASLGKQRKEQSGDANVSEKTVMRSVLGALGYLARESRPDLSGPASILQSRFNRAQVSDIQETNRVVRLAKAYTDFVLPVCKIPLDHISFVS